jgi:hypothetical protein
VADHHLHHADKVVADSPRSVYNNFRNLTAFDIEDIYVMAIATRPATGRAEGD